MIVRRAHLAPVFARISNSRAGRILIVITPAETAEEIRETWSFITLDARSVPTFPSRNEIDSAIDESHGEPVIVMYELEDDQSFATVVWHLRQKLMENQYFRLKRLIVAVDVPGCIRGDVGIQWVINTERTVDLPVRDFDPDEHGVDWEWSHSSDYE